MRACELSGRCRVLCVRVLDVSDGSRCLRSVPAPHVANVKRRGAGDLSGDLMSPQQRESRTEVSPPET